MIVSGLSRRRFILDDGGVGPETLELVVVAGLLIEDVNNHVAVVQKHPAGMLPTFATKRLAFKSGFEMSLDIVCQAAHMTI